MGSTTNYSLPYPEETTAPPDVAADMHSLATAADTAIAGLAATVKPLDTVGTNITSSAPADTKLAGTSGKTADAGHRHAREAGDAVAGTASPRTLGTGTQQAAAGNHTHDTGSWTAITTFASGFQDGSSGSSSSYPAAYRKVGSGTVQLRGSVSSISVPFTTSALTTILTLPTGFRPAAVCHFAVAHQFGSGTSPSVCRVSVNPDGTVVVIDIDETSVNWVSLDGISFGTS